MLLTGIYPEEEANVTSMKISVLVFETWGKRLWDEINPRGLQCFLFLGE